MFFAEIVSAQKSKGEVRAAAVSPLLGKTDRSQFGLATEDSVHCPFFSQVLVFQRAHLKKEKKRAPAGDIENGKGGLLSEKQISKGEGKVPTAIQKQTAIFHWEDICYDIKIKKEERRILDHVNGWVKPGA